MKRGIALLIILTAVSGNAIAEDITLDGSLDGDSYSNSETVSWYNGHHDHGSVYGDADNPLGTTTIRYGTDGTFFYLYVEVPLYAKNMVWESGDKSHFNPLKNLDPNDGLVEADVAPYRVHWSHLDEPKKTGDDPKPHHKPDDFKLDFGTATGSEKAIVFNDENKKEKFTADLAGNVDDKVGLNLLDHRDSVDYLFANNLATEELSLNRDTTMSFEFQFELNTAKNDELLDLVRNGIEFHLSPERGLAPTSTSEVPEPSVVASLIVAACCLFGYAWVQRRKQAA